MTTTTSTLSLSSWWWSYDDEYQFQERLAWSVIAVSVPIFIILQFFLPSPWGKSWSTHRRWLGPHLPARPAWFFFECPNLYWSAYCYYSTNHDNNDKNIHTRIPAVGINDVLLALFVLHYIRRAILYPLRMNPHTKPMPLAVVLAAFAFTNVNGYLQAQSLCRLYDSTRKINLFWLAGGFCLFVAGMSMNVSSDAILLKLSQQRLQQQQQKRGTTITGGNKPQQQVQQQYSYYSIPTGGWFDYVSTPHYTGEMLEWFGFAMMQQFRLAAMSFWIFTMANLIPRAVAHHAWYQSYFDGSTTNRPLYPPHRKAFVPFVW